MTEHRLNLNFPATPGAPIACDMRGASDTADERIHEYGRLFAHALIGRERKADAVVFRLAVKAGVKEWIADLARREAVCCPFLSYRVRAEGETIYYEIVLGDEHAGNAILQASLDEIHALPDRHADGAQGFYDRLASHGVSRERFEVMGEPSLGLLSKLESACGC